MLFESRFGTGTERIALRLGIWAKVKLGRKVQPVVELT